MTVRSFWFALLASAAFAACLPTEAEEAPSTGKQKVDAGQTALDPPHTGTDVTLQFQPSKGFTGFDGTHTFVFPIAVYGAKAGVEVTAADPTMVDIVPARLTTQSAEDPDDGAYFLVTAKKAGSFELIATSQGASVRAPVTIASYSGDRFAAGESRYTTGGSLSQTRCTECHTAMMGAPDHSPAALAGIDDAKVESTIRSGLRANGIPIMSMHTWDATEPEMKGLITYLRALPQTRVVPGR